jgi:hypothetical protein
MANDFRPLATPCCGGAPIPSNDERILRERMLEHDEALDQLGGFEPPFGSARFVGQVYNGGSMPSTVPAVYLVHPTQVSGAETEGGAGTLTVDADFTVPVVVLGHVPSAGDYLDIYAASGRWVSGEGTVGECNTKICVFCITTPISGASVMVLSGVTTIASGTTGANGCVTLNIGSAGTYTVNVTAAGYNNYSASQNLTCGGETDINLCACPNCFGASPPNTIHITVTGAMASFTFAMTRTPNQYVWTGSSIGAATFTSSLSCAPGGIGFQFVELFGATCLGAMYYPTAPAVCPCGVCCVPVLSTFSCNPIDIVFQGCGYFVGVTFTIGP